MRKFINFLSTYSALSNENRHWFGVVNLFSHVTLTAIFKVEFYQPIMRSYSIGQSLTGNFQNSRIKIIIVYDLSFTNVCCPLLLITFDFDIIMVDS